MTSRSDYSNPRPIAERPYFQWILAAVFAVIAAAVIWCVIHFTRAPVLPIYSPAEASDHAGQSITVEGVASVYKASNGTVFIDLGGQGRKSPFAGVIFKQSFGAFPNVYVYDGKTVDITGVVQKYRGKPQIHLTSPTQLQIR